ncbi:DUF2490 domain-containing protein [Fulvivirga lutea]|uniref:DUF2490 domain-containing protein n=2 Tax=Fulvivirga lutea TaxID=2810512 RepID=A0A974WN76_9BACT|nr:DUF2490 domain-containing protein [Fulvivirga lutea]
MIWAATSGCLMAQDRPKESVYKEPVTAMWINTYGNIRISNHLFWIAQTHFRTEEKDGTPFAGQIAQIYNRHALSYLFSKKFNVSLGGVLRVNWNTAKNTEGQKSTVPEWRIWHEYMFAMPFDRLMVYHRLRVEHRWTKGFNPDSEFIFRNRWRYMFKLKMPVGKPKLGSNTFYFSPEAELIMQSGGPVIDSPMEDLRLHASFGYIINPRLSVATGVMHSHGQDISDGTIYKQKWTMRFHVYFSPDLRKVKHKLPSIHTGD